jgi:prephenate dehydrogenase
MNTASGGAVDAKVSLRHVIVIGTGLIGTSIALAMCERGTKVSLSDRDAGTAALAAELGAGDVLGESPGPPADLAVLAVPPAAVAGTLRNAQKRGLARVYTDVASVKAGPLAEAAELGCDMSVFVAGHPMAGRERSGPAAARADLFLGRPWALCPSAQSDTTAIEVVTALVRACGAAPLTVDAAEHDRAVALVSHAPHVVSAAMAARFGNTADSVLGLAGQGVRDVIRIAAGEPRLWLGILSANAVPVADVLEEVSRDLELTASALREQAARGEAGAVDACADVTDLLLRGNKGHARIPGKHGGRATRYAIVAVLIPDRPGELALVFQAAGVAGVNIEDVVIEHSPGRPLGIVELSVKPEKAARLAVELRARGWTVPARDAE